MKTIFADFNARTETGDIRLNSAGSQEDLRQAKLKAGDCAWLSDGELVVGARIEYTPTRGFFGIPKWKTLVHLDDAELSDFTKVWDELRSVLHLDKGVSKEVETRVLQLLTVFELTAPPEVMALNPQQIITGRRFEALTFLGELDMAVLELRESLRGLPTDVNLSSLQREVTREVDRKRSAI